MFESKKNNVWFNIGNQLTANTSSTLLTILGGKETLFGADFGINDITKHFKLTLTKFVGGVISISEVVKVTAKSGNALTIVRAYEPCPLNANATVMTQAPQVFDVGDFAYMNMTASDLIELGVLIDTKQNNCVMVTKSANYTFTGTEANNTGFSTTTTSGNITYTLNPALFPTTNGMYEFTICKSTNDVNTVIIDVGAGKTIDTAQTYTLTNYMETITIRIASSTFVKVIATTNRTVNVDINTLTEDTTGDITADFFIKNNGSGLNKKIKVSRYMATNIEASTGTDETKFINPKQAKDNYERQLYLTVSDDVKLSAPTERTTTNTTNPGSTLKSFTIGITGTIRIAAELKVTYDAVRIPIYKNGSYIGQYLSGATTNYVRSYYDLAVNIGDVIELKGYVLAPGHTGYIRNVQICYTLTKSNDGLVTTD